MGPGESSLNAFAYCCMLEDVDTLRSILGRELTIPERNMLGWEPRCATCASTERMLRARQSQLPGASNQGNTGSGAASFLEPCPTCRTTFFCSREHQKLAQQFHNGVKTSTACGNLTQCQANQLIREDVRLSSALKDAPRGLLVWAPERTKTQWESFKGSTWKQEFLAEVQKGIPLPRGMTIASFLHTFSEGLSIPMTILHALDTLNGENTDWTRKHKLVIHVLGAARLEIQNGMVFEEVVHRLPQLKEMEVVMYGPELQQLIAMDGDRVSMNMDTCPKCQRAGRKRVHTYIARLYHSDVTHSSPKPDLAIAFDAGVAAHQDLWKPTIKLLVEQEIPSVFTVSTFRFEDDGTDNSPTCAVIQRRGSPT
ncbi:hypothetical protein CC2G_002416 [Coprinopsis cinerea AmutBmut pab1-1]|nr:hypothetical protein CC2G_002416 [Coprinopsis cinerea AmutBmut pab1-1]